MVDVGDNHNIPQVIPAHGFSLKQFRGAGWSGGRLECLLRGRWGFGGPAESRPRGFFAQQLWALSRVSERPEEPERSGGGSASVAGS
jgi:hypothetical protein